MWNRFWVVLAISSDLLPDPGLTGIPPGTPVRKAILPFAQ
jgi:hypothetical protein